MIGIKVEYKKEFLSPIRECIHENKRSLHRISFERLVNQYSMVLSHKHLVKIQLVPAERLKNQI